MPRQRPYLARWRLFCSLCGLLALTACGEIPPFGSTLQSSSDSAPRQVVDLSQVADAIPRQEPRSRYGNPPSYTVAGKTYHVRKSSQGFVQKGIASWYGTKFHGRRTSSGEAYDMYTMTAAHKTLPLPTYVEVKNLDNGRQTIVRVNDRGPFREHRIIDLSYAAATRLGITQTGTARVEIKAIDPDPATPLARPPERREKQINSAIWLQVGAYREQQNAERAHQYLAQLIPQNIGRELAWDNQRALYRLRIGPLNDRSIAEKMIDSLSKAGLGQAHIIKP